MSIPAHRPSEPAPSTEATRAPRSARTVVLPAVLGAGLVLGLATQTWATGSSDEVLVGAAQVSAPGSRLVPLAGALALAAAAASVVAVTGGRVVRLLGAAALLVAGLGSAVAVGAFLAAPEGPLAADLASRTARSTPPAVHATVTWAPWAALVATLLLVAAGVRALQVAGQARGLSRRYDSPVAASPARDEAPAESLWDRVSRERADDDPPAQT